MKYQGRILPPPPPATLTIEEIMEDEKRAEEAARAAEVEHLHALCQTYADRYDKLKLAYERAKVRHYDAMERQRAKCVKVMLKKFAMWVAIVLITLVIAMLRFVDLDTAEVRTANLGEYITRTLYKQSAEESEQTDATLCPTVYVTSDVPSEDYEDYPNRICHLRRNRTYTFDVYVFYSDPDQFGRNISLAIPKVVTQSSLLRSLTVRYTLKGEERALYWVFLSAADKDVRIDEKSLKYQEITAIINSKDRVKDYIAKAGVHDLDELSPNLYHYQVTFRTTKPRKTYTYTSETSSIWWDLLVIFVSFLPGSFLLVLVTTALIGRLSKSLFFREKRVQETTDAGNAQGDGRAGSVSDSPEDGDAEEAD